MLLSTKNLKLKLSCRKLSPTFIGPFRIQQFRGPNVGVLEFTDRWKHLNRVVNIEYLRPYSLSTGGVGPGPQSVSVKTISVEPDDSSWYQIAEILDHNGPSGPKCRCLVRWEGFDVTHDSWILRKHVTLETIIVYEQFLTDEADLEKPKPGKEPVKDKLDSFIGLQGQFSVIAQRDRQKACKLQRDQRVIALEASDHDNTPVLSTASDVLSSSGSRLTRVPQCFKSS